jgi:hypothetical protein
MVVPVFAPMPSTGITSDVELGQQRVQEQLRLAVCLHHIGRHKERSVLHKRELQLDERLRVENVRRWPHTPEMSRATSGADLQPALAATRARSLPTAPAHGSRLESA